MVKKELKSHLLVTVVYFILISLLRFHFSFDLVYLWVGALLGAFLLDLDHVLLGFDPSNRAWWAEKFRFLWQQKKFREAIFSLVETHLEHRRLIFHSVLFQPILLVLALFVLTSTGCLLGSGLVMSMNLHLLKDEWECFLEGRDINWLFWQVKRKIDKKGQKIYLLAVTFIFFLLSLFLI